MSSIDYISGLPDCLITHILSFVSTKEAASTSVLAKRWRYLFAFSPNLDLDDSIYLNPENKITSPRSFVHFVDRVLALHQNIPLNRFSLKCEDAAIHLAIIASWLLKVMESGVLDLDLNISCEMNDSLPWIFVNETLVRLKLRVQDILSISNANLPKVKTLCLDQFIVETCDDFAKLLNGCQALEELVLNNLYELEGSSSVFHYTLKRLVFRCTRTIGENNSVSFCTPNLVFLDYSDTIADKYPKVEFGSLVEARLDLRMTEDQLVEAKVSNDDIVISPPEEMVGNVTKFLKGICNVKILYLSQYTLQALTYCCKAIPEFNNLIHLTIQTHPEVSWRSLPALLKNCPKIETLVFEGLHYGDTIHTPWEGTSVWLSSSLVKKLKVLEFGVIFTYLDDMDKQMDTIKYFVETMPNLEEVVLYYGTPNEDDLKVLVSIVLKMLKKVASTKCKIQVISGNMSFSSTVYSTSTTAGLVLL